jgi:hypothetical protein
MEIELQLAVENLLARYVHALDDDRLEEWPEFFVEEGRYRITTAENFERKLPLPIIYADSRAMLRDRVSALRHANIYEAQRYRHVVSSVLVERIDGRTARHGERRVDAVRERPLPRPHPLEPRLAAIRGEDRRSRQPQRRYAARDPALMRRESQPARLARGLPNR